VVNTFLFNHYLKPKRSLFSKSTRIETSKIAKSWVHPFRTQSKKMKKRLIKIQKLPEHKIEKAKTIKKKTRS
jgi:hypothetical protein